MTAVPAETPQVVEQFVIAFPTFAAWLIVGLLVVIATGAAYMGRKFLQRMDTQDASLNNIEKLLASEVGKLRTMLHGVDRRVVWLESKQGRLPGEPYGRREDDDPMGESD